MAGEASYISKYTEAYKELAGMKIKEADVPLYNKLAVLAAVSSQYDSYVTFKKAGYEVQALDNLICAAGRSVANIDAAKESGCEDQLNALYLHVENVLQKEYEMTMEEALEIYNERDREDYTIALQEKILELGLE